MPPDGDVRPPLRLLRAFTTPKNDATPNEDRWHSSIGGTSCAISDGASVSFDPAPWAEILVRRFVVDPIVDRAWLQAAVAEYQGGYDRESMPWMQQAGFDRGSFATLLGIACLPDCGGMRVVAIGDSLLAFVDGTRLVKTLPYVSASQFDDPPSLLSTNPSENAWLDDDALRNASIALPTEIEAAIVLLMTDALGRWLLDNPDEEHVRSLLVIHDDESFVSFVKGERQAGRLRKDDSTLLVLGRSE